MAGRGPPPTPAELRLLKGRGKGRDVAGRIVGRQPKAVAAIPAMPEGLGPHGERIWRLVTPEMARMGILGVVDLGTLELYCRLYQGIYDDMDGGRGLVMSRVTAFMSAGSKLGLDPALAVADDLAGGDER